MVSTPPRRSENGVEHVHRLFRGSSEFVKRLLQLALVTEVIAAVVATCRALDPDLPWPGWASLALAGVVLLGVASRMWAKQARAFGERCRRVASSAYAYGLTVPAVTRTSLAAQSPSLSLWLSERLPAQTLEDYFECTLAPGLPREREIYAHSAFYSWRLLDAAWRWYLALSVVFFLVGGGVIYSIAVSRPDPTLAGRLLDVICSVVFVVFMARAADAALEAFTSSGECKDVADQLALGSSLERQRDLVIEYNIERTCGPTIPTWIYMRMRDALQAEWMQRRAELR
jgi:hypothetical protein